MDMKRGPQVLVIGGLGFIGLNLVRPLLASGARVRILNRSVDPQARTWLDRLAEGHPITVCHGELSETTRLEEWLEDIDAIVNLAGESGAERSVRESITDMHSNVASQLTLLDKLREMGRSPVLVFASSRLVYGVTRAECVDESRLPRPTSVYGVHKLTVEHYHRLYWELHGIPSVILRLTNPYGPYQLPRRRHYGILNRFVMAALRGESIKLYGDGVQLRDYVHVDDVADAVLKALHNSGAVGETFNIGSGASVALGEVARRVVALAGSGTVESAPWPEGARKVETGDFRCDIRHARERLGWSPTVDLDAGLLRTISSYRELIH